MVNNKSAKNTPQKKFEDPELEAEVFFAKEHGLPAPNKLASDLVREKSEPLISYKPTVTKNGKGAKAERKARSRGVSGSSSRKDGNRFEYGFDCIDFAYESNPVKDDDDDSIDGEDEYFEYDTVVTCNDPKIRGAISDYFTNGSVDEAIETLEAYTLTKDIVMKSLQHIIVANLEYGPRKVKAASLLMSGIVKAEIASIGNILDALSEMLSDLENLLLDYPNASKTFEQLFARLVFDEVLTVDDLEDIRMSTVILNNSKMNQICLIAKSFAKNPVILRTMFEPSGSEESLDIIDSHFVSILRDYFINHDQDDSMRRLKELGVPHYHHSFVLQALVYATDKITEQNMDLFIVLLKHMLDNGFLTTTSLEAGFHLFFDSLIDLKFDLPLVYSLAKYITESAFKTGLIRREVVDCYPHTEAYTPLVVEARKRVPTDDEGIGSLSSNVSSDEDSISKMSPPMNTKDVYKGNTDTVKNTGNCMV